MPENIQIEGDHNNVLSVARDLNIGDTYTQEKPVFFEPSFDRYEQANTDVFVKPRVGDLVQSLKTKRLLMLGGVYQYKLEVVRYCSWAFKSALNNQYNDSCEVLEWYRSSDPRNLVSKLQETKETTIFILPDIDPFDINYDIDGIERAIKDRHFLLVTTDKPKDDWQIPSHLEDCWKNTDADKLYRPGDLSQYLSGRLKNALVDITPYIGSSGQDSALMKVAEALKTPEKIDIFIHLLAKDTHPSSPQRLTVMLNLAINDDQVIAHWFHRLLSPREQLLALGLSIFDGLLEDQCLPLWNWWLSLHGGIVMRPCVFWITVI